jgi:hypothetical protein
MTKGFWIVITLVVPSGSATLAAAASLACASGRPAGVVAYPTFCGIPATPHDVRGAEAFKADVVETRREGRRVTNDTGPQSFGLPIGGAEGFASAARAEATNPAMAPAPAAGDTDTFVATARDRARAPKARAH